MFKLGKSADGIGSVERSACHDSSGNSSGLFFRNALMPQLFVQIPYSSSKDLDVLTAQCGHDFSGHELVGKRGVERPKSRQGHNESLTYLGSISLEFG